MRLITCTAVTIALLGLFTSGVSAAPAGQKGAEYIGEKKCKMCHKKQHATWTKMKHANNFSALVGDEKKDPSCLACHTTGYGKGGYDLAKPAEHNAKFENVQCESCHGPGSKHMKAKKPEKKNTISLKVTTCSGCHNPHVNRGEEAKAKRAK